MGQLKGDYVKISNKLKVVFLWSFVHCIDFTGQAFHNVIVAMLNLEICYPDTQIC